MSYSFLKNVQLIHQAEVIRPAGELSHPIPQVGINSWYDDPDGCGVSLKFEGTGCFPLPKKTIVSRKKKMEKVQLSHEKWPYPIRVLLLGKYIGLFRVHNPHQATSLFGEQQRGGIFPWLED